MADVSSAHIADELHAVYVLYIYIYLLNLLSGLEKMIYPCVGVIIKLRDR